MLVIFGSGQTIAFLPRILRLISWWVLCPTCLCGVVEVSVSMRQHNDNNAVHYTRLDYQHTHEAFPFQSDLSSDCSTNCYSAFFFDSLSAVTIFRTSTFCFILLLGYLQKLVNGPWSKRGAIKGLLFKLNPNS